MSNLPSISIVLCTYQGERFLSQQLESLAAQTLPPMEIIVQDDASTDRTLKILEEFRNRGLPLKIEGNSTRLGFAQNFAKALSRVKGEFIFFCDQDDRWDSRKLENLSRCLATDSSLSAVLSEANCIDENGALVSEKILEKKGLGSAEAKLWQEGKSFPFLLRKNPAPGMLLAIRASLLSSILPIPQDWEHDYWILLLLAALGKKIGIEPEALVQYRIHRNQAIGATHGTLSRWKRAKGMPLRNRLGESQKFEALRERAEKNGAGKEILGALTMKRAHLLRRGEFSSLRILRGAQIALELARGTYHTFDAGWTSALKDWIAPSS